VRESGDFILVISSPRVGAETLVEELQPARAPAMALAEGAEKLGELRLLAELDLEGFHAAQPLHRLAIARGIGFRENLLDPAPVDLDRLLGVVLFAPPGKFQPFGVGRAPQTSLLPGLLEVTLPQQDADRLPGLPFRPADMSPGLLTPEGP